MRKAVINVFLGLDIQVIGYKVGLAEYGNIKPKFCLFLSFLASLKYL